MKHWRTPISFMIATAFVCALAAPLTPASADSSMQQEPLTGGYEASPDDISTFSHEQMTKDGEDDFIMPSAPTPAETMPSDDGSDEPAPHGDETPPFISQDRDD